MPDVSTRRFISHLDMDTFFVSVERLKNSSLMGKPLIVGGSSDRGVVAACSYETRAFGVHSAMPMRNALRLCPHAIIVKGDFESYSYYSRMVTDVIKTEVPVYEKASIDEFYTDLTGMDKYFGISLFMVELKRKIVRETGLPISYALASNKLLSKIATNEVKPNGQIEVLHGTEKAYLAPMHVSKMPGIGGKTVEILRQLDVATIRVLSEVPLHLMEYRFGKYGISMHQRANGIDDTPVVPYHEQKSIGAEETFVTDTFDELFLNSELVRLTERIAFQLRQQKKLCGCVTIKLRYSNFHTETKQVTIGYTSADHTILQTAKDLLKKIYDHKLPVRLLGVRLSHLVPGEYQIDLFNDTIGNIKLYQAMDAIRNRFGGDAVHRAIAINTRGKQSKAL